MLGIDEVCASPKPETNLGDRVDSLQCMQESVG